MRKTSPLPTLIANFVPAVSAANASHVLYPGMMEFPAPHGFM